MYGLRELILNRILSIRGESAFAALIGKMDSLFTTIYLHLPESDGPTYHGVVRIDRELRRMDGYSRHDLFDNRVCDAFRTIPSPSTDRSSAKNPKQTLLLISGMMGAMTGYVSPTSVRSISSDISGS